MEGFGDIAGQNYEMKMSALLFLRALQTHEKFHIASNLSAAGKFDDVVLKLGESTYFLQLKHKQNSHTVLKLRRLAHDNDFKLKKYLESLQDIKKRWENDDDLKECGKFEAAKFIIFTNVGVDDGLINDADTAGLSIVNTGGKLVSLSELCENLSRYKRILSSAVGSESVTASPQLWEVVHKLHSKQARNIPNKKLLQEILENLEYLGDMTLYQDLVPQLFLCTQQSAETDLDDIIKREIYSDTLFDQLMKAVMNWWRTSNEYLTEDWKEWQHIFNACIASITQPNPLRGIIFQPEYCVDILEMLTCGNRKLFIKSDCINLTAVKVLQTLRNNSLLIDVCTLEHMNEVMSVWVLGMCNVLVVKGMHKSYQCNRGKTRHKVTKILECELDFQGYSVCLNSLADISHLQTQLSADVLMQLQHTQQVGHKMQELDPCYMQRTFIRYDIVREDMFGKECMTLAIAGVTQNRLSKLLPSDEQVEIFNYDTFMAKQECRYWLVETETEFTDLCKMKQDIHWIEACEQGFRWIQSKGDMSRIRNYFKQESTRDADSIVGLPHKVVLIVAEPGMGKSTELTNIAHVVKQKDPSTWVVRVNLNECVNIFKCHNTAVEFLQQVAKLNTQFEKGLLEHQLLSGGNVVILVDAFDEISPNYTKQVLDLLSKLSEYKIKKIIVTSRPVMEKELEHKLSSTAFSIRAFDSNDQKNFLLRYWNTKSLHSQKLSEFVTTLFELVETTLNDSWKEFAGIPLQCRLLAEVFQDDANHFCKTGHVRLPPSLDLLLLYEQFVEKMLRVYCEKLYGNALKTAMLEIQIQDHKQKLQENHMNCAMFSYFDYAYIKTLRNSQNIEAENNDFIKKFICGQDKIGIVTHIVGDKVVFVHRTFAEYFVAIWLSKQFQTESDLTKQIYFHRNLEVIRIFLDRILAKGFELHTAVINSDFPKVENLVSQRSNIVNERDTGARTALHLAVMNLKVFNYTNEVTSIDDRNNVKYRIIETLLENGADVNCEMDEVLHCRPLRLAEGIKAWSVVDKLLGKQADDTDMIWIRNNVRMRVVRREGTVQTILSIFKYCVNCECKSGICFEYCMNESVHEVLYTALQEGYMHLVKFILKCGVSVQQEVRGIMQPKSTMLHIAVGCGHLELVQFLIEQGSDVDSSDEDNTTLLMKAAWHGHVKVAELLVKHGASVNAKDVHGNTALFLAAENRKHELVELLLPLTTCNVRGTDSVICAAGYGNIEAAQILIQNNIINSQTKTLKTALLLAADLGSHDVVELLLEHGAEVDKSDSDYRSPLMRAAARGHMKVAEFLVQHGANINARDSRGRTAVLLAAEEGHHEVTELVLQHGADVNISGMHDTSPLMLAAASGHEKVAELLVEHGSCVNARDSYGRTALLLAAEFGRGRIVEMLIQHGADVNVPGMYNRTPLMQAAARGHVEVAHLLIKHGASLNTRDSRDHTALFLAARYKHNHVVKLLEDFGALKLD
ncbi:hypothetical protein L9F63_000555 [Diploptera punctata]|uniref:NACHT domain-containing protein n=1 Tax=Diploptera punctata TaxID=6984 RepID=A0AAD8AM60_DIPPU|nr:hypothetical protein L9F63_000555 [Diploptera punctata]